MMNFNMNLDSGFSEPIIAKFNPGTNDSGACSAGLENGQIAEDFGEYIKSALFKHDEQQNTVSDNLNNQYVENFGGEDTSIEEKLNDSGYMFLQKKPVITEEPEVKKEADYCDPAELILVKNKYQGVQFIYEALNLNTVTVQAVIPDADEVEKTEPNQSQTGDTVINPNEVSFANTLEAESLFANQAENKQVNPEILKEALKVIIPQAVFEQIQIVNLNDIIMESDSTVINPEIAQAAQLHNGLELPEKINITQEINDLGLKTNDVILNGSGELIAFVTEQSGEFHLVFNPVYNEIIKTEVKLTVVEQENAGQVIIKQEQADKLGSGNINIEQTNLKTDNINQFDSNQSNANQFVADQSIAEQPGMNQLGAAQLKVSFKQADDKQVSSNQTVEKTQSFDQPTTEQLGIVKANIEFTVSQDDEPTELQKAWENVMKNHLNVKTENNQLKELLEKVKDSNETKNSESQAMFKPAASVQTAPVIEKAFFPTGQAERIGTEILARMKTEGSTGTITFEMLLNPENLGKITIKLVVDKLGNVSAEVTAEKAQTALMLQNSADKIAAAVEKGEARLENFTVEHKSDYSEQREQQGNNRREYEDGNQDQENEEAEENGISFADLLGTQSA